MSGVSKTDPTKEELDALPYDFTDLEVYFDNDLPANCIQYVLWHDQEVRKPSDNLGSLNTTKNQSLRKTGKNVTVTNHHTLKGFYDSKQVCWSRTQTCWVYNNNKPVNFPKPETSSDDSNDKGAVTAILE